MGAVEAEYPDRPRALGLHLAGQRLRQAAEHRVGQHLADHMAGRHRARAGGIDAGAGSVTRSKQESEPVLLGTWGAMTAFRPNTE